MVPRPTRCSRRFAALPWTAVCALVLLAASSYGDERGFPLITVYPAEVHKAGPQNFDVTQDPRGILYFGNLHGLVTYDGAWWRLIKLPDDQLALSVAANGNGVVALGLVNDFGQLGHGAAGEPEYRSLLPLILEPKRDFGDVRAICVTPAGFLFVAERRLLIWNGGSARVLAEIDPATGPRRCHMRGDEILLYGPSGLQRFDPAAATFHPPILGGRVDEVIDAGRGRLIAAVRDGGLFSVEGSSTTPFAPEASEWVKGKIVSSGTRLTDGRLVVATRQHGIALLTADGEIEEIITDTSGLPDAVITDAFTDREGSLWLAMEGPIARIDLASPVSLFDARRGLKGGVNDIARFGGDLYVATTYGVHRIGKDGVAHAIEGMREAWRLLPFGDELLIGSSRGLFSMREGETPQPIFRREGEIYDLFRSAADPSRVWIAQRHGLGSVRRDVTGWVHEEPVKGAPEYGTSVVEHGTEVWVGTVFDGVARVRDPRGPAPVVDLFGTGETNVFIAGGRVVAVRAAGEILSVDGNGRYVRDPLLGHISAPRGFFGLVEDARGDIWINSTPPRVFEKRGRSWAAEGKPLVSVTAADIQTMRATADGAVWFAADKGLFRYAHPKTPQRAAAQAAPLIRRVVARDAQLLFGGGSSLAQPVTLRHDFGRIRIEFAPASFRPGVEYQYRLDPVDAAWSSYTEQPFIDYTNLEAADYTFRLRARGPSMIPSEEVRWPFEVLPPWYRTRWAYALWALLAAAAVVFVIRIRTATLQRQAEKLRHRVEEKTAELQATVNLLEQANTRLEALSMEDELTGIANRRYFERALADEWNRARRREHPLALILIDLDHFKDLNDRLGHQAGDDCLRRVGAFLSDAVRRSGEVVARYGGEEFAILLPGVDADAAIGVAESLRAGIEELGVAYVGSGRRVTASCGVAAIIPAGKSGPDELVAGADRALYAAKHSGRNCVRVADDSTTGTWLRDASA